MGGALPKIAVQAGNCFFLPAMFYNGTTLLEFGAYHTSGTMQARDSVKGLGDIGVHSNKLKTMLGKPIKFAMFLD